MNDKQDLLAGCHHDPFAYLGMHPCDDRVVVRAFLPHAESVQVAALGSDILAACERVDDAGLFEARLEASDLFAYELVVSRQGHRRRVRDPYSFWPMVSSYDQHLFASGAHLRIHEVLGAHLRDVAGVAGVHFCVWAPGGRRVSVIGDFNDWDGRVHPMLSVGDSGLWELFLPDLTADTVYKY
ncbi:MAG: 1,4-alpha-glucan branching enzyme, partial [Candidatus Latescibacterota bacterium]|nr:1,4-alpha-glucan branching enzyme [Candidatus Latescibacterota bacterium]